MAMALSQAAVAVARDLQASPPPDAIDGDQRALGTDDPVEVIQDGGTIDQNVAIIENDSRHSTDRGDCPERRSLRER